MMNLILTEIFEKSSLKYSKLKGPKQRKSRKGATKFSEIKY